MLHICACDLNSLRLGENRDRNELGSIVASQVGIAKFKITHSSAGDSYKGWSVDTVFPGRATLEAGIDYRKRFEGRNGQHGTRPPLAFANADNPDPNRDTWTKLADLISFHWAVFPPPQLLHQ